MTANWDAQARDYQRVFREAPNEYNARQMAYLMKLCPPGAQVLDVGCGVGRYARCFLQAGCSVTVNDASSEMLRYAQENLQDLENWRAVPGDFQLLTPAELGGPYDLAISTMSPAVQTREDVEKLSAVTRGVCMLSKFTSWAQPNRDALLRALGLTAAAPGCTDLEALLGEIRAAGYEPEVTMTTYDWCDDRTPAQMADFLRLRLGLQIDGAAEEAIARACDGRGLFADAVHTDVAWICWHTERR